MPDVAGCLTNNPSLSPVTVQVGSRACATITGPNPPTHTPDPPADDPEVTRPDRLLCTQNLFEPGTTDCNSYYKREPSTVISEAKMHNVKKYGDACVARWESFHPFIISADGLLGPQGDQVL